MFSELFSELLTFVYVRHVARGNSKISGILIGIIESSGTMQI